MYRLVVCMVLWLAWRHPCGSPPDDPPQYVSFGDSVSKGIYRHLAPLMPLNTTWHPGNAITGGCGSSARGLACTATWLGKHQYELITFNYGLHDLARDHEHVPLDRYRSNLREIVATLTPAARRVYWVSTTPVPVMRLRPCRASADVRAYNEVAAQVMRESNVTVVDLYAFVTDLCGVDYASCPTHQQANVHFTPKGYAAMARYVYRHINTS